MKELKFRYYDEIKKQMIYSDDCKTLEGFFCHYESSSNILEQYACTKDKKDKEIYEEDILKSDILIGKVVFDQCRFWFQSGMCLLPLYDPFIEFEIIGNIHEHPHLLENR